MFALPKVFPGHPTNNPRAAGSCSPTGRVSYSRPRPSPLGVGREGLHNSMLSMIAAVAATAAVVVSTAAVARYADRRQLECCCIGK